VNVSDLPDHIESEAELDKLITRPSPELVRLTAGWSGPTVILGIGGKMGTHLGMTLSRALKLSGKDDPVIGVSRFSDDGVRGPLESLGIRTHAADLLDPADAAGLPDASRVVFMAGRKFGTGGSEYLTWAMNTLVPEAVCRRYAGTPIVAFSTGAVYDRAPADGGGSVESDPLTPVGEYANAAVGRERVFEYMSRTTGTPVCQIRLFYAVDLRYGVIRDIGDLVYREQEIDLTMGYVNVIWHGDAVDWILRSFPYCAVPPRPLNVTGPEIISVRRTALRFGELMGKTPRFTGREAPDALLGNTRSAAGFFGSPSVNAEMMIRWIASWIEAGGRSLNKPTHFEVRNGKY
jgi:nucleoside-diphosphate-sugar epimerase